MLSADNASGLLKPGMTATAEITVKTVESALLVPNAALRFVPPEIQMKEAAEAQRAQAQGAEQAPRDPGAGRVFAQGPDGRPVEKKLRLGATDGEFTEVLEGEVQEGDVLLTDLKRQSSGAQ